MFIIGKMAKSTMPEILNDAITSPDLSVVIFIPKLSTDV